MERKIKVLEFFTIGKNKSGLFNIEFNKNFLLQNKIKQQIEQSHIILTRKLFTENLIKFTEFNKEVVDKNFHLIMNTL